MDALELINKKLKEKGEHAAQIKGYIEEIRSMTTKEHLVSLDIISIYAPTSLWAPFKNKALGSAYALIFPCSPLAWMLIYTIGISPLSR